MDERLYSKEKRKKRLLKKKRKRPGNNKKEQYGKRFLKDNKHSSGTDLFD